jgi:hypothetical protein
MKYLILLTLIALSSAQPSLKLNPNGQTSSKIITLRTNGVFTNTVESTGKCTITIRIKDIEKIETTLEGITSVALSIG